MLCTFASLDNEKLEAIKTFEKKTGKTLLAYSCKDIGIDALTDDELTELKQMEEKLGVQLVSVA